MTWRRTLVLLGLGATVLALVALGLTYAIERFVPPRRADTPPPAPPAVEARAHITATLFYATDDGQALVPVRAEVPLAEGVVAQGAQILMAQLGPAPSPYVSVIPKGTTLRAFYVTGRGDAFVDLSPEITTAHPGGSLTELLTVYAIVNAVTANLSAVQRVQLLVNGKEVETLAGHVDVRQPLAGDTSLVREPGVAAQAGGA
jgi:spore germination protein GerM